MAGASPFRLSCELRGHKEDVRAVCILASRRIATGSRDKTIIVWKPSEGDQGGYSLETTLTGHRHFVTSVAWLPPNPKMPIGAVVSGGMDKEVLVWDTQGERILATLRGHTEAVTGVAGTESGDILSASQDKTARRWRDGICIDVLNGHESAVQAVVVTPNGEIVTGSSDCTIKVWQGTNCIRTARGHTDTVRALSLMDGLGLVSASHDGSVRLWAQSGEQLLEMVGHTALIYSVATHNTEIASGSEDNTVRIWRDGSCLQTIEHPGCIWAIAYLPNGDLVTACADGVARIWSRDPKLAASAEVLESYEAQLSATRVSKTVGGVKVEDLPGIEALQQPGKKDGQHKVIREGEVAVAYSWSAKEYNWEKIGEVVDGPSDPLASKSLDGIAYDYVFDVDIGDGIPPRKLPFNRGQNPYDVADKWLEEQGLPAAYREQVVQFIMQNSGQTAQALHNTFYDPYTGGQAYVPPSADASQRSGRPTSADMMSVDPYTGPTSSTNRPSPSSHIPKKGYLLFDSAQYDGILKKLEEFNYNLSTDETNRAASLSEMEVIRLQAILTTLRDTSHYHSSTFADADFALLSKIFMSWPRAHLFPALDLLRMMLLHPQSAKHFGEVASDLVLKALRRAAEKPAIVQNHLTGLRTAVNTFRHTSLRPWTQQHREEVLDLFADCRESANKNVRLAWATLLLNFSVLMVETADEEGQIQVLSAALEVATLKESDVEVLYRALLAVGTLVGSGSVKSIALDLDVNSIVAVAEQSKEAKLAEIGKELRAALN